MISSVCIATPSHSGQTWIGYSESLLASSQVLSSMGCEMTMRTFSGSSFIGHARNVLVKAFLFESNAEALLFIDADTGWSYVDMLSALAAADEVDAVGVAYRRRNMASISFAFRPKAGAKPEPIYTLTGTKQFIEADWIGTGFLLLKRNLVQELWDKSPEYNVSEAFREVVPHPKVIHGRLGGEDVLLGARIQELGRKQSVCLNSTVVHYGSDTVYNADKVTGWLQDQFNI